MKGAIMTVPGEPLELLDIELGTVEPHEVQVRVERASVCHTDLTIQQGNFPMPVPAVIGHEAAGVVEAVGDQVTRLKPGDRVIAFANPFCGHCGYCHRGDTFLCTGEATFRAPEGGQRVTINGDGAFAMAGVGAFSETMLTHENSLAPVPGELPFTEATLLGCGVSTGLGAALNTAGVGDGDRVVVLGCGTVGLSAIQGARVAGASRIFAVDLLPSKLRIAQSVGATDLIDARDPDAVNEILESTSGGVDTAIECIGKPETTAMAVQVVGRGGTAVLVGFMPLGANIELPGTEFLYMGKRLVASVLGSTNFLRDLPKYGALIESGDVNLDPLTSDHFSFNDINVAMSKLHDGEVLKPIIDIGQAA